MKVKVAKVMIEEILEEVEIELAIEEGLSRGRGCD
jgi:hypothetical protein